MSAIILLVSMALTVRAEVAQYKIQPAGDAALSLEVEKTGIYKGKKHQFVFPKLAGTLAYDAAAPEASRIELKVDSTAIEVRDNWVNEKDRKRVLEAAQKDMLAVSRYPEMRFASTRVVSKGGNRYTVDGTLTIRGIGKPVTLDVTMDPATMRIEGKSMFKLTNYGLKPPSAALGAVGTKDEMTAMFQVQAVK